MFFICILYALIIFVPTNEGLRQNISESSLRTMVTLGTKSYVFGTLDKVNYFEAAEYCNYHRMGLVTIEYTEENELLLSHIRQYYPDVDHFWTSGTDLAEGGKFVWLSTGERFSFESWNSGEPNNAGNAEHCVEIKRDGYDYHWNDSNCNENFFFICELTH